MFTLFDSNINFRSKTLVFITFKESYCTGYTTHDYGNITIMRVRLHINRNYETAA